NPLLPALPTRPMRPYGRFDEMQLQAPPQGLSLSDAVQLDLPKCPLPVDRLPLRANPTPPPFAPVRPYQPRRYMRTIGAQMVARRRRGRVSLPLFLILLGGIVSAIVVPMVYDLLLPYF